MPTVRSFHLPLAVALLASASLALAEECPAPQLTQGQQVFARDCGVCHTSQAGGPTLVGPNLHGVVGRVSGSVAGVAYSQALKTRNAAWTAETINAFIEQPQAAVPGTYMPYAGMPDAAERQAVVCFLSAQK